MGIRFACHACGKHLNIKTELGGRRGICPACSSRFRIPTEDAAKSTPIEAPRRAAAATTPANSSSANSTNGSPAQPVAAARQDAWAEDRRATDPAAMQQDVAAAPSAQMQTRQSASVAAESTVRSEPAEQDQAAVSALDLLTSDPSATWYVRPPTGGQYGPANGEILRQWIGEGRVGSNALIWRDGWPQWREASEAIPELGALSPNKESTPAASFDEPVASNASSPSTTRSSDKPTASQERTSITGDDFGYEDSDFAKESSVTAIDTGQPSSFVGKNNVGADRRKRTSQRTTSIIFLAIIAVLLILALGFIIFLR